MKNTNIMTFKGIYYTKSSIFASEIRKGVKPYLLDSFPDKLLVDVIENSPIFNDLKNKTDVYVSSYTSKTHESTNDYTRYIRAIFKDPYRNNANNIDSINITATGDDEIAIFGKLKNILTALPNYKTFTNEKFLPRLKMIFLGKNGCDGFIRRCEKL